MKKRLLLVLAIPLLMFLPMVLSRQAPHAKAANRIKNEYLAVEAPLLRLSPEASWEQVDHFLGKVKAIDVSDAPKEVERAFVLFVSAVEANSHVRRVGGDTNAANERVAAAKVDFVRTLEKWRGQPF